MAQIIVVTSGKGGVGKSSICANLGRCLANMGHKVALIDMDLGLKNLDVILGLENRVVYDLNDAITGRCPIEKALVRDKYVKNLYLLSACKTVDINTFNFAHLKQVVSEMDELFDYVILDSPAGIEKGFISCMELATNVIIVATLDVNSIIDADKVVGIVHKYEVEDIRLVLNKVNPTYIQKGYSVQIQEALDWLSLDLLGIVYEDEKMINANNHGIPIVLDLDTITSRCFYTIAKRLRHENVEIPKLKTKSFLEKMFNR